MRHKLKVTKIQFTLFDQGYKVRRTCFETDFLDYEIKVPKDVLMSVYFK